MFDKKRAMNKKGQAAMEFLMTYGWAILAAVIVVGVLWFMIGNPANLAGDSFKMSTPVAANAVTASVSGVILEWRNGGGESMTQTNVSIAGCTPNTDAVTVTTGELVTTTVLCPNFSNVGDRISGDVTIAYIKSGSALVQRATGSVSVRVV